MNIVFILKQPYPNGMACSKRVHLYAKGLKELGNKVSIIIPRATESGKIKNTVLNGKFEDIEYQYSSKSTIRPNSFFKRRYSDFISPLKAGMMVYKKKPDIVFLISPLFYHTILFKFFCLLIGSKFVKEKNEVPFMHKDSINKIQKIYLKVLNAFFNGVVVITRELDLYYKNYLKSNTKSCIIPIIVEFSDVMLEEKTSEKSGKLLYTGALLNRKDGILIILEAFKIVLHHFPNLGLYITGDVIKSADYLKVQNAIIEFELTGKVFFTGFLSDDELKNIMIEADLLLLAKPINRQNKYNFPTKVGEYLSSGTPVLISDVGETMNFLKDQETAFISKPNPQDFADKIIYILNNYNAAIDVAQKGKQLAYNVFNYKTCTIKLHNFLKELI